jgi:hypothetical protein
MVLAGSPIYQLGKLAHRIQFAPLVRCQKGALFASAVRYLRHRKCSMMRRGDHRRVPRDLHPDLPSRSLPILRIVRATRRARLPIVIAPPGHTTRHASNDPRRVPHTGSDNADKHTSNNDRRDGQSRGPPEPHGLRYRAHLAPQGTGVGSIESPRSFRPAHRSLQLICNPSRARSAPAHQANESFAVAGSKSSHQSWFQ